MKALAKVSLVVCVLLGSSGCESGFQAMESTEHGVVFSALPPFLGGGVRGKILPPSAKEFILPWETLYRMDTGVQSVSWAQSAMAMSKRLRISCKPARLTAMRSTFR